MVGSDYKEPHCKAWAPLHSQTVRTRPDFVRLVSLFKNISAIIHNATGVASRDDVLAKTRSPINEQDRLI